MNNHTKKLAGLVLLTLTLGGTGALAATGRQAKDVDVPPRFSGYLSWYGPQFHGKKTASGKIFNMNGLSSAHRRLPFYTKVLVENPKNGRAVVVEVLDRGPFVRKRVMDLSREAARRLGTLLSGVAWCDCLILDEDSLHLPQTSLPAPQSTPIQLTSAAEASAVDRSTSLPTCQRQSETTACVMP